LKFFEGEYNWEKGYLVNAEAEPCPKEDTSGESDSPDFWKLITGRRLDDSFKKTQVM
jgi:hypothetical protein